MPPPSSAELTLPTALAERADRTLERLMLPPMPPLRFVLGLSTFAERVAAQQTAWLRTALNSERFAAPIDVTAQAAALAVAVGSAADLAALLPVLRQHRNRLQFQVLWRHLLRLAPMEETVATLSALADTFIGCALDRLTALAEAEHGVPRSAAGERQTLTVLALGKLGARALNLSSDVDLIYCYDEPGKTDRGLTNDQFFTRLGQNLLRALDQLTADGFVYRVDLRLRPFGASGPLVIHGAALAHYYQQQGRDWERYALQKARVCAGDRAFGQALLERLEPFVYRRYLDFGMVASLREMKAGIVRAHRNPVDVKLGPGGIRDVEFAVQVLQLIWGGRQPSLRTASLEAALRALVQLKLMPAENARVLRDAYRLLRDTEHSLQAFDDQQTQSLPGDDLGRQKLALSLGYERWEAFAADLEAQRKQVRAIFTDLVAVPDTPADDSLCPPDWWILDRDALTERGFKQGEETAAALKRLARARDRRDVEATGRARVDALVPLLLELSLTLPAALKRQPASEEQLASDGLLSALDRLPELPDRALQRVVPLLVAVLRRSVYLALLLENPGALRRLLLVCAASRWLAERVARRPALLDALLDERQLFESPAAEALRRALNERLDAAGHDDERWFAELRDFKEEQQFAAALGQVRGIQPLMTTSDHLTFLAEAVLEAAHAHAWQQQGRADQGAFLVLGFGKLGGMELGPDSDLDLVFLHDLPATEGPLLQRLSRSLLSVVGTQTVAGPLYSVDTRLRPAGTAGTMVTQIDAFERYERERAWTFEHQALIRARPVVGDAVLAARFAAIRRSVLCQRRDAEQLKADVLRMHDRLRQHYRLAPVDVKRAAGGIVDLEFLVQYLVLAHAFSHPELVVYTDNVRILAAAATCGVLSKAAADELTAAYLALRTEGHRAVLDLPDAERSAVVLNIQRACVARHWEAAFGEPLVAITQA